MLDDKSWPRASAQNLAIILGFENDGLQKKCHDPVFGRKMRQFKLKIA